MNDYLYIEYENKTEFYNEIVKLCKFEKHNSNAKTDEKRFAIEGSDFLKLIEC